MPPGGVPGLFTRWVSESTDIARLNPPWSANKRNFSIAAAMLIAIFFTGLWPCHRHENHETKGFEDIGQLEQLMTAAKLLLRPIGH